MREMGFMEKLLDGAHVEWKSLASICKIETGKLNANAATEDGAYMFFTTAKEVSKIDKYRWDTEALLIAGNANVGDVKHYSGKFEAYQRTYVLTNFSEKLNVRYLFHIVSNSLKQYLEDRTNSAAMTYIVLSTLENFPIPIPCPDNPKKSLEIQAEIVRILDAMTAHTAEITAEITARKKQYDYYRDKLLSFDEGEVEWRKLGEVATVTKLAGFEFTNHVRYADSGKIIALRGLNVKGNLDLSDVKYIDGSNFSKLSRSKLYIDDMLFTYVGTVGSVALIDEDDKYYLAPNVALIRLETKNIIPRYMFYYFQTSEFRKTQIDRYSGNSSMQNLTMENIRKFKIAIPSLSEQARIVEMLDKFDALTTSLTEGLPREIELREKQYAYYRDLLLSFPAAQAA